MNRDEVQRLAAMTHQLRPDWPWRSLVTFIETELYQRAYRDAAVALAAVATDPVTRTPRRVLEAGPWWQIAPTGGVVRRPLDRAERCSICNEPRHRCERIAALADDGHTFTPDLRSDGLNAVDPATGELVELPDPSTHLEQLREALTKESA